MVTYLQFYKAVKSYYYRKSLLENIGVIETCIVNFLKEKEVHEMRIPEYFVSLSNGTPIIEEAPFIPLNQLELKLSGQEEKVIA